MDSIDALLAVLRISALAFLAGLALTLLYLALAGRLKLRRLPMEDRTGRLSLARSQLLLAALLGALALPILFTGALPSTLGLPALATETLRAPLAWGMLLIVAASNLIYLASELRRLASSR